RRLSERPEEPAIRTAQVTSTSLGVTGVGQDWYGGPPLTVSVACGVDCQRMSSTNS
ncbi:MAG: hypothetical protein QG571_646, partial [Pseudomonadota bacterium]|nr:hypothetical protein [Pseudomonadota bacterium]